MKRSSRWDWRVDGVFVAIWAGLAAGAYGVGFAPQVEARQRSASDLERLALQEDQLRQVQAQIQDVRKRLAKAEQQRDGTPVRLGKPSEINQRLARLSAVAESCGVKLDQLEPGKPYPHHRYAVVPIRLAGVVTYPGLAGFFQRIHQEFPDSGIPGFSLTGNQDRTSANGRFTIDLAWYTAPDAPAPAR